MYNKAVKDTPMENNTNQNNAPYLPKTSPASKANIGHVIAVISGKGGVGKSFTASYLAVKLRRKGFKVGILDADVTGPSVPFTFNVKGPVMGDGGYFYPVKSRTGIEIMSSNLLLDNPNDPIVWRGPMIATLLEQFYTEVIWDVDYLIIDMAPGTSDISLTIFQKIQLSSAVLVSTPQSLVNLIVEKSAKMASMLNVPLLSLVENEAYVLCPKCGEKIRVFGEVDPLIGKKNGIPVFDEVPFDPEIAKHIDSGDIESLDVPYLDSTVDAIIVNSDDEADRQK